MVAHVNNICYWMRLVKLRCYWTDSNPRRKFYGCELNQNSGGRGFFEWFDSPMCNPSTNVILGVLRNVDRLETQLRIARRRRTKTLGNLVELNPKFGFNRFESLECENMG
ncbi:hypothetical protein BUALT_Bualt17G0037100 [Buddleja alternifolia]|uniref:Zinc finger GRF-type domain-containing protein n=1 Tax=Buddleja alternifolia TaxID=168488 RepID=A0AAV6WED8_9LAMI|nr:hypothetical protein BUALT_Bualt17G0037100 [Buddleja alternifolia]